MPERLAPEDPSDDSTASAQKVRPEDLRSISEIGSGLAGAVRLALGSPPPKPPSLDASVGRGGTVHLGADYLAYARRKFSAAALKRELETRLAPVYAKGPGPIPGKPFGKFEVLSFLGKGGMAEVFKAIDPERDPKRGQEVALKVMKDDLAGDPTYVRRFLREAANAALVESENVVQIHEVGAVRGRVYFTMELVQGQTLKERLTQGPFPEGEGLQVLRQLVNGIAAAHEKGIGHRDLKPSNVMLAEANSKYGFALQGDATTTVKLMDFGLARMYADDDEPEVDAEGRILGTAKYVAPELVAGTGATLQSDVFSLGIIAFQLFCGRSPWKAKNKLDYLEANLRHEAPPLREFAPDASAEVSALVVAMLEKDPANRPTSVSLLRDVDRLLARRGTAPVVVADDPTSVFFAKRSQKKSTKSGAGRGKKPKSGPPWSAVAILVGVVAVLGVVALLLADHSPPRPPPLPPPPPGVPDIRKQPPPPPARPPVEAPVAPAELVPGKLPSSLAALASGLKDEGVKVQVKKDLEDGDRSWMGGNYLGARDRWRAALVALGSSRPLQQRIDRAEREVALERAQELEDEGRLEEALAALDEAERKGATVEVARRRLRERRADEQTVKDALDEVAAAVAREEFDLARVKLRNAEAAFGRVGRKADYEAKLRELDVHKDAALAHGRAEKLLEEARASLERGELDSAAAALEAARRVAPDEPGLAPVEKKLARMRGAPAGTAYVELAGGKGLYVRKAPVTNREWKEWLDAQPPGKRRSVPWITGTYPPAEADEPVRNVKADDASAFAAARNERLPAPAEREAIGRALGAPAAEGTADARGALTAGFRTVREVPE